jgi:hypothetical protein
MVLISVLKFGKVVAISMYSMKRSELYGVRVLK